MRGGQRKLTSFPLSRDEPGLDIERIWQTRQARGRDTSLKAEFPCRLRKEEVVERMVCV